MKPFRRHHNRIMVIEDESFDWGRRRRSGWSIAFWVFLMLSAGFIMLYFNVN